MCLCLCVCVCECGQNRIETEYSLGKYNAAMGAPVITTSSNRQAIVQFYDDGAVCDLTGAPRKTKVCRSVLDCVAEQPRWCRRRGGGGGACTLSPSFSCHVGMYTPALRSSP